MKKCRFNKIEMYLHEHAIMVLCDWIIEFPERFGLIPIRIESEEKFCDRGVVSFIPDVSVYGHDGICSMFEVVYKNALTGKKLNKMQQYFYENQIDVSVYEISSEYIMKQVKCPDVVRMIKMI